MNVKQLYIFRQTLLAISIVYFFVLAIGISQEWPLGRWEDPRVFAAMGVAFLSAILIEAAVVWWDHRSRILWGLIALAGYAVIGFVAAPRMYGNMAIFVAMAFPVIAVFFGGFAFVFAHLFARAFRRRVALTPSELAARVAQMPGWVSNGSMIEKRFRFDTYEEASRFAEACLVVGATFHRHPDVKLYQTDVGVRINTPDINGVMERDLLLAKEIDQR